MCVVWAETGSKTAVYNEDEDGDADGDADGDGDGESNTVAQPVNTDAETQYLIKWKHWSHIHNTWESEASLLDQNVNGMKKLENYCKRDDELQLWYVLVSAVRVTSHWPLGHC